MYLKASINLILLVAYNRLGLGLSKLASMRLLIVYHTIKKLVGIIYVMLIMVASFIFPSNFVILDYEVDLRSPSYWKGLSYPRVGT